MATKAHDGQVRGEVARAVIPVALRAEALFARRVDVGGGYRVAFSLFGRRFLNTRHLRRAFST